MTLYGASAREYGMIFASNALGTVLTAQINRLLLRKYTPQQVFSRALVFNIGAILALLIVAGRVPMWGFMIPLWFCIASIPMIFANAIAIAMAASRDKAGSASAIIGLLQFGLASIASSIVSLLHNGTAYPMILGMLGGVVLGALVNLFGVKHGESADPAR
jgi:DHA1 family bicyclomycin/chloramphenicol resistance-like MFS transporter